MSNTATRLITLIMLLQRRPNQKAGDLADALGVSVRSLHRYIGMLEEMGIPIYSERGPAGGFSLVRGYKMPPLVFTPAEAVSVALGARLLGEVWGPLYAEAAEGALAKLDNVLPDEQRREVEWAMHSLVATGMNRAAAGPLAPHLETLQAALRHCRRVELVHRGRGRGGLTERTFDTYALVHGSGWWYAVGFCHLRTEVRAFRIDRIVRVTLRAETYTIPLDFDVHSVMAFAQAAGAGVHVRMRFRPFGAEIAAYNRAYWQTFAEQPDGSVVVTFHAPDLVWASSTALSYGSLVVVEAPPELVDLLRSQARAILQNYEPAPAPAPVPAPA
jgi:predicted DNA-binding transcriptional regulator YafY